NELESTRIQRWILCALLVIEFAIGIDKDGFARQHITQETETQSFQCHGFAGNQIFGAFISFTETDAQRADTVRVAESQQTMACDLRRHRIRTTYTLMQYRDCL